MVENLKFLHLNRNRMIKSQRSLHIIADLYNDNNNNRILSSFCRHLSITEATHVVIFNLYLILRSYPSDYKVDNLLPINYHYD